MDEVTSGSPQAMDGIIEKFKKIQLSDYPGKNVRLMINDIQASYNLLKSGQCLPTTVSTSMVTTKFLLCQVKEFLDHAITQKSSATNVERLGTCIQPNCPDKSPSVVGKGDS